jgi:hypothetical protein
MTEAVRERIGIVPAVGRTSAIKEMSLDPYSLTAAR